MSKLRVIAWILGLATLLVAITGTIFLRNSDPKVNLVKLPLGDRLPRTIGEWVGEDLPLGGTEVLEAATKQLNYNDYVYRVYRKGNVEVFVYAMYWEQGRISIREIAGHTPDGCWIANGAQFAGEKEHRSVVVQGQTTAAAEIRTFLFGSQKVRAVWWHFWGDDLVDRAFDQKSLVPTLRELWTWLVTRRGKRQDQVLVRLHASGGNLQFVDSDLTAEFLSLFPEVYTAKSLY